MYRGKIPPFAVIGLSAAGITGAMACGVAFADSLFIRDRNISVADRARPDYAAPGIRAGQFIVHPKIDIGVGYNSNVFSLSNIDASRGYDSYEEESDFFGLLRPSIRAESDWTRHSLTAGAYVEGVRWNRFDDENVIEAGLYADGIYDIAEYSQLFAGGSYDSLTESRRNYNSSFLFQEPVRYDLVQLYLGGQHESGRFRYMGRTDLAVYDYDDIDLVMPEGTGGITLPTDQDYRDRQELTLTGEVGFALSPDKALFLTGAYNWVDFDQGRTGFPERDSEGYRLTVGAETDLTRLIRGRLDVGYFSQEYDDPAFETLDGMAVEAAIEWFPTELTTVTLNAERGVAQSAIVSTGGYISNDVTLGVDHELLRNLILSGFVAYGEDEYDDPLLDGSGAPLTDPDGNVLTQSADKWGAGLGATYYVNRYVTTSLDYTYETQDVYRDVFSGGFNADYDVHQLMLTVTLER